MTIVGLIIIYIILDLASILVFGQFNKESFKKSFINFYKVIKLINIKEFDDSFEINTTMNGGYMY